MHKSQLSQSLTRGTPASDQAPHSGRPASSRSGAPSTSRGLLPIDGKVIAVEDVFGCSSPDIPVLVVVYRNTSKERVVYTVKVSKTSTQHDSGWPTTSVLCIYSTVTWGPTDIGLTIAKPPLSPPAHLQGGTTNQIVVSRPVGNTSPAVSQELPPHQQTGMECHIASTPLRSLPSLGRYRLRLQTWTQWALERATMDYILFNWRLEQDRRRDFLCLYFTGRRRTAQNLPLPNKVQHDRTYVCWPSMLELNKEYVILPCQSAGASAVMSQ